MLSTAEHRNRGLYTAIEAYTTGRAQQGLEALHLLHHLVELPLRLLVLLLGLFVLLLPLVALLLGTLDLALQLLSAHICMSKPVI